MPLTLITYIAIQFTFYHAIYIGVVEISDIKENRASMSIRVFYDDLQDVLRNHDPTIKPTDDHHLFITQNQSTIEDYFKKMLVIQVNESQALITLEEGRKEGDVYILNFVIATDQSWQKIELKADFFTELFPQQTNVISVNHNDHKYHARITISDPSFNLSLIE